MIGAFVVKVMEVWVIESRGEQGARENVLPKACPVIDICFGDLES